MDKHVNMDKWDRRYIELAKLISSWSKDPSTGVGAVIIGDNGQVVSQGYNGFPRGIADSNVRLNTRELKYAYTIHAESNAIYNAISNNANPAGCTIYVHGLGICCECAKAIIQCGISRVVYDVNVESRPEWSDSTSLALDMFKESGVTIKYMPLGDLDETKI